MGDPPATREIPWNGGQIVTWVLLLFLFTSLGALPLILQGLNLSRISQSTPHLPLVMIGMLTTSCAPTLAALFIVGLYPGAGGVRSISRQLGIWCVGLVWYGLALVGPIILLLTAEAFNAVRRGGPPPHWIVPPSFSGPAVCTSSSSVRFLPKSQGGAGLHNPGCRPATAPYQPVWLSEFFGAPGICGT